MKNDIPSPGYEELTKLRQQGLNRDEIADYYGVALSRVKRWITELEIPAPEMRRKRSRKISSERGTPLPDDYGLTSIERAQRILGKRMSEDYRGYLLDGRPVRVDILIQAAGISTEKLN